MRFDTKLAIVVRSDLATWQRLNVTAFLASAVAGGRPEVIGQRYTDGSGSTYLPMFRATVAAVAPGRMPLVGLAVYGPRNGVDKVVKGLPLHP